MKKMNECKITTYSCHLQHTTLPDCTPVQTCFQSSLSLVTQAKIEDGRVQVCACSLKTVSVRTLWTGTLPRCSFLQLDRPVSVVYLIKSLTLRHPFNKGKILDIEKKHSALPSVMNYSIIIFSFFQMWRSSNVTIFKS